MSLVNISPSEIKEPRRGGRRTAKCANSAILLFTAIVTTISISPLFVGEVEAGEFDLTVRVEPGTHQCFFQTVEEKHKAMEVDYQVIDGGDLNVNFMLIHGSDMLKHDTMKTDGSHRLESPAAGEYQICFDNTFSYQSKKTVFFEVYLYDANGVLEEEDVAAKYAQAADPEMKRRLEEMGVTVQQFQDAFGRIKSSLNKIEIHQSTLRAYEARDRAIMTANNDRVLFWSVVNAAVLMAVGAVQVYMIRSLFEENSKLGRALRR